jgi:hypothetical protein
MYFLYMYEYGSLKPVDVILSRGRKKRKNNEEDEPGIHCMRIWKCHNKTPCTTIIY